MKYFVSIFEDNIYEVLDHETNETLFQGTLADCEAWIKLKENDNVQFYG